MAGHPDVLDIRDPLRRYLAGSIALHILVVGGFAGYAWMLNRGRGIFGDPNAMGGAVGITAVSSLPMPQRSGRVNRVAVDTESQVPTPPKAEARKEETRDDPDAVVLKGRNRSKRDRLLAQRKYRAPGTDKPNQTYSNAGQAASSPMYGGMTGAGGVGLGVGAFGNRFGWYQEQIQRLVAQKWRTNDVDQRLQTAPPVIVTFDLARDGTVRNVNILQRSGNYALDISCQRAVLEASPLPPLPAGYERDTAKIEFWFTLRR